jgi:hypothetical protein
MPPRFPIVSSSSSEVRSAALLLSGAIVIAGLYFGREVLLPLLTQRDKITTRSPTHGRGSQTCSRAILPCLKA